MHPLDHLVEQLWAPALDRGARVSIGEQQPDWETVESYRVIPGTENARLLVPAGPPGATTGSLLNYRHLRQGRERAMRSLLASAVGAAAALPRLRVEIPAGSSTEDAALLLPTLATALGRERLHASVGVRTGANRKATLQLVDEAGGPVGYAKVGWNKATGALVATETAALEEIAAGAVGAARAPKVLARLRTGHGYPVVVTEPLPVDVRGGRRVRSLPTPQEVASLCPPHRVGLTASSGHLQRLRHRLAGLIDRGQSRPAARAAALVDRLSKHTQPVPMTVRWHGDLTSWNVAREPSGLLWVWDWETAEHDALAGLDAIHWCFSRQRLEHGIGTATLAAALEQARDHLWAVGWPRALHGLLPALYAAVLAERAGALAVHDGGWDRVYLKPADLDRLMSEAEHLLPCP